MQLAMAMGVKLEKMLAPQKVKLAVSGCPRNRAEAGIKDVGGCKKFEVKVENGEVFMAA